MSVLEVSPFPPLPTSPKYDAPFAYVIHTDCHTLTFYDILGDI